MLPITDLARFAKLSRGEHITGMAFGSSNTQRRLPGMTWFDYLELGFRKTFDKGCGLFFNAGVGGDTSQDLLNRFARDVSPSRPDLVIITVGGNDSSTLRGISATQFADNLLELHRRVAQLGGQVLFQTYYACMLEQMEPAFAVRMEENMQVIRDVAAATNSALQDHYTRWQRLRQHNPALYKLLMDDAMHVNDDGNAVMGLDLLRSCGVAMPEAFNSSFRTGCFALEVLNLLEK